jgi:DNA polymerase III sliding clamp (beta) subunit (PCNA family)
MEFTISDPSLLRRGLQSIDRAAEDLPDERSAPNHQVRLRAFGQQVELLAHDHVVQAATLLAASVASEGSCCVSVRLLQRALEIAPGTEIRVALHGSLLLLDGPGWGRRIPAVDSAHMRDIPAVSGTSFTLAAQTVLGLLGRTAHAADADETRPDRNCVVLRGEGMVLRATAADSQRAAMATAPLKEPYTGTIVIHRRALRELRQLLAQAGADAVEITSNADRLFFRVEQTTVAVQPVTVTPANPNDYFGSRPASQCVVNPLTVGRVLRAAAELSGCDAVTLCFNADGVVIKAEGSSGGAAEDAIAGARSGDPTEVTLNNRNLREAVAALGGDAIRLQAGGRRDAVVVRPSDADDAEIVIMPMSA